MSITDPSKLRSLPREGRRAARARWPQLPSGAWKALREITTTFGFRVEAGDLLCLNGWYVTHTGLLGLATRRNCVGMEVHPVPEFCDPKANRWVFVATVFPNRNSKGFSGFGDADPTNVGEPVRGAELRVAETRAVNRALRKAYGIGLCSVEELGASPLPPADETTLPACSRRRNPLQVIAPVPLRDQLRQLIRQHRLDPVLTKSYALRHLGVKSMRDASREQVAELLSHLQARLFTDRDGMLSELARPADMGSKEAA